MTLSSLQKKFIPEIEKNLQDFVSTQEFGISQPLNTMIAYHMGWDDNSSDSITRGKRIRPMLTLLTTGAFDVDPQLAMPAAIAIELLHNFTLIHDDIQDNSPLRHGRPTLWTKWGVPQAINAGDALFSIAQCAILGLSATCDWKTAVEAAIKLNQVCLHLTCGQYLDIAFESSKEIALDTYLNMIEGKTAALIAFSASTGGMVASQDSSAVEALYDFGKHLGLAFQIQDDYLGIWGNPNITGKSTASDLITRKKTLPVIFGLIECPGFRRLWEDNDSKPGNIDQMSNLLETCGAKQYVRTKAEIFTQHAFDQFNVLFPEKNSYAAAILELCELLLHRHS